MNDAVDYFNQGTVQQNQAALAVANPNQVITGTTTQSGGTTTPYPNNVWAYDNTYYLHETDFAGVDHLIGDMVVHTQLERTLKGSTKHEWTVKANLIDHVRDSSFQNSAIYQGFNVTPWSSSESIVAVSTGTTNASYSTGASVSVGFGGTEPAGGFSLSWSYDLPAVYQTFNGSGTNTAGWNYSFRQYSLAAENGNTFAPGFQVDNTTGPLDINMDDKLSMLEPMEGNIYTTSDQGAAIYVNDWGY